jgi:4,5:9,10-diseco-3-hydroxy-5,9,17-trioxoandrosta-1(10),2-diene-4-oate hydrolase
MEKPQDQYVQVGSINTRYWAEGSSGSPIILIHGLGGFVESWLLNVYVLAEQHRVYAADLPGHGHTDKPVDWPYRVVDMANFVKDFMTALGIDHAHVIGHSLGGAVAARLTIMHPHMIDKLVLESAAGLGREMMLGLRLCSIPLVGEIFTRPSRDKATQTVTMLVNRPTENTDELIEMVYQLDSLPGAHRGYLKTLRANINVLGQRPRAYGPIVAGLEAITKPALAIWGKQDDVVPAAHAQVAAERLPDVRVELFDQCGHLPMLEKPDRFNDLVLEFLKD